MTGEIESKPSNRRPSQDLKTIACFVGMRSSDFLLANFIWLMSTLHKLNLPWVRTFAVVYQQPSKIKYLGPRLLTGMHLGNFKDKQLHLQFPTSEIAFIPKRQVWFDWTVFEIMAWMNNYILLFDADISMYMYTCPSSHVVTLSNREHTDWH